MRKTLALFASIGSLAIVAPINPIASQAQDRPSIYAADPAAPHVFGAIALPLGSTRYDGRWQRVSRAGGAEQLLAPLLRAARPAPRLEQLRLVNASLNQRIRYRFDDDPSGDYWSTARETLNRSAGD